MTLALALLLDALFGEPKWLWSRMPHPAVLMGRLITWADARYNEGQHKRRNGVLTMAALAVGAVLFGLLIQALPGGWLLELFIAAILLAHRSLVVHVQDVANALRIATLDGRVMVARIVGRDTHDMNGPQVARAAIESAAENFSDGVVAPAFWFLVAGLPGLLLYKVTNTADSMIGYRTERHERFGWAAARLDDVLNWIPARLTAVLFAVIGGLRGRWPQIGQDARKHRSPNAGWPEAAMARAIGVAVSGPRAYEGQMRNYPFVNAQGRQQIGAAEIDASIAVLWRSWAVLVGLAVLSTAI